MSERERLAHERSNTWNWSVCCLLLCATMLNYMDRQTLSLTKTEIVRELGLTNYQYGWLESGFGFAFATGAIVFGVLADRIGVRWLYPFVFLGWSAAGAATAYGDKLGQMLLPASGADGETAFVGLLICRTVLGFFESGHWPCALITTQRILRREDRSFGNSLLQSGASLGAIFTPLVVQLMVDGTPGSWRGPYLVIGVIGVLWIVPWLSLIRPDDIRRPTTASSETGGLAEAEEPVHSSAQLAYRFATLIVTVTAINLTWQYFRAWLPSFLREFHGYSSTQVNLFTSAYYISTDVGCLAVGFLVRYLTRRGVEVHRARSLTFLFCSILVLGGTVAAVLPRGPLLMGLLLLLGFGALGLFPNYYAFTQEITFRRQGLVTGILGATTWTITSIVQPIVGASIDRTKSYALGIQLVSLGPLLAWFVIALLWNAGQSSKSDDA